MPVEDALNAMADRVGGEDFKWVVLAINIQRQVGGNLATLLSTVANTLREREQVRREDMRAVFLEYAWDMSWCDPCAADPLTPDQLRQLGVMWLPESGGPPALRPQRPDIMPRPVDAFVTRLHLRYDGSHFPEELVFQETGDRANFQARYVLRHPYTGDASCSAADAYRRSLPERRGREAQMLATLTGWNIEDIRKKGLPSVLGARLRFGR